MKIKNKILYYSVLISIFSFGSTAVAYAFTLAQPIPGVGNAPGISSATTFCQYVTGIMPYIFGLAVVIAVVQLVIGGMQYALSEGLTSKEDAKDRISAALLGLALALLSWLILNTINSKLVNCTALDLSGLDLSGIQTTGNILTGVPGASCPNGNSDCASNFCSTIDKTCKPATTGNIGLGLDAPCTSDLQCSSNNCSTISKTCRPPTTGSLSIPIGQSCKSNPSGCDASTSFCSSISGNCEPNGKAISVPPSSTNPPPTTTTQPPTTTTSPPPTQPILPPANACGRTCPAGTFCSNISKQCEPSAPSIPSTPP